MKKRLKNLAFWCTCALNLVVGQAQANDANASAAAPASNDDATAPTPAPVPSDEAPTPGPAPADTATTPAPAPTPSPSPPPSPAGWPPPPAGWPPPPAGQPGPYPQPYYYPYPPMFSPYPAVPPENEAPPPDDPETGRMLYADTALLPPAGKFTWRSMNLGGHYFGYTVTDNVQIGATTMVPAGAMGIAPEVKIAGPLSEQVHMGVTARAGVMGLFFGDSPVFSLFGGGPMLTVGDGDLQFTVGTVAYGLGADDEFLYLVYPYAGGSVRVADMVKLNLEFGPALLGEGDDVVKPGQIWLVNYGVRFFGENFFGDVGFMLPACEAWFDTVGKYLPLGVPMLMFGYSG